MIIDFKYIPTFAQNKTNIPMKRIVLLLIALLAVGCSKSEEKIVPDDLKVSWTYIQDKGDEYKEKYINLSFTYDEYLLIVIETGLENGKIQKVSRTEKGKFSYSYPNLTLKSSLGVEIRGIINEKRDELTLYNFRSILFIPKTNDITLTH